MAVPLLTVVTFNVLFERYYVKYAALPTMPAADRAAAMQNTLQSLASMSPLICLQESDFNATTGPAVFSSTFRYIRANVRGESCGIAYDTQRFDLVTPEPIFSSFVDVDKGTPLSKLALSAILIDKQDMQPVRVTSVHVPWAPTNAQRAKYLAQILEHLASVPSGIDGSGLREIVCGDFNIDQKQSAAELAHAFSADAGWSEASGNLPHTVIGARGQLDKIDFIFTKGFTAAAPARMLPESPVDLVKHTTLVDPQYAGSPPFTTFCSDHCAVIADLTPTSQP